MLSISLLPHSPHCAGSLMIFPFLPFMVHDFFPELSREELGNLHQKMPRECILMIRDLLHSSNPRRSEGWLPRQCLLPGELHGRSFLGLGLRYHWTAAGHAPRSLWHHQHGAALWLQSELWLGCGCPFPLGHAQWQHWSGEDLHV